MIHSESRLIRLIFSSLLLTTVLENSLIIGLNSCCLAVFALDHSKALDQQLFFVILLGLSFQGATVD